MVKLLCSHLDVLRQVYDTFSDQVEGVQVIKLATSASQQGGLYKLLELYDVTPTYLSKVEAKVLFTLTLHAQVRYMMIAAEANVLMVLSLHVGSIFSVVNHTFVNLRMCSVNMY